MIDLKLWPKGEHDTEIHLSIPKDRKGDGAVIVFPGGGYARRAAHETYTPLFDELGVVSLYVDYRVSPDRFPLPLLDARRAVRYLRAHAAEYGIAPDKIAVMGSSAGGHLAALVSTYRDPIEGEGVDELDDIPSIPNAQILCYPVITLSEAHRHVGSARNLMGDEGDPRAKSLSPDCIADEKTPPAFIWHTSSDAAVPIANSYLYAHKLSSLGIPVELHVFPMGKHGLGVAPELPHVAQWTGLLHSWLMHMNYINE